MKRFELIIGRPRIRTLKKRHLKNGLLAYKFLSLGLDANIYVPKAHMFHVFEFLIILRVCISITGKKLKIK